MPDAAWAVFRIAPKLIPGEDRTPGFDTSYGISTPHQRFAFARLSGPYLTGSASLHSRNNSKITVVLSATAASTLSDACLASSSACRLGRLGGAALQLQLVDLDGQVTHFLGQALGGLVPEIRENILSLTQQDVCRPGIARMAAHDVEGLRGRLEGVAPLSHIRRELGVPLESRFCASVSRAVAVSEAAAAAAAASFFVSRSARSAASRSSYPSYAFFIQSLSSPRDASRAGRQGASSAQSLCTAATSSPFAASHAVLAGPI